MQEQPIRQPSAATNRPKPPAQKPPALPMTAPPLGPTPVDPLGVGNAGGDTDDKPSKPSRLARALEAEQFQLPVNCSHCRKGFRYKLPDGGATVECPHCREDVVLPPLGKDDVVIALLLRVSDQLATQNAPRVGDSMFGTAAVMYGVAAVCLLMSAGFFLNKMVTTFDSEFAPGYAANQAGWATPALWLMCALLLCLMSSIERLRMRA